LRCGKCRCVYYCNAACQKKNWKEHKKVCDKFCAGGARVNEEEAKMQKFLKRSEDSLGQECVICFDPITQPMQLECEHVFCVDCIFELLGEGRLGEVNEVCKEDIVCPLCRNTQNGGDMLRTFYETSVKFIRMAGRAEGELRTHYVRLAEAELDKAGLDEPEIEELLKSANGAKFLSFCKAVQCAIAFYDAQYRRAIAIAELAMQNAGDAIVISVKLELQGYMQRCYIELGMFKEALELTNQIIPNGAATPNDVRQALDNTGQIYYHLGDYNRAIEIAEKTIELKRHYPHVYKYLVLSHKALGDWDLAISAQKRALRYDSFGEKKRLAVMQAELAALLQERDAALAAAPSASNGGEKS
jgi:tetratricopeptide (TPR) repeat protein